MVALMLLLLLLLLGLERVTVLVEEFIMIQYVIH
jgi:hypothetical protein